MAAGNVPPPLPPSVEAAYKKKCIELKRRLIEVDEDNDAKRLRIARLHQGIRKMRLERAYLLEALAKRQKKNGSSIDGFPVAYDEESEGSSEGPPTPNEKPLRSKRSHRRPVSSPPPILGPQFPRPIAPSQGHPTSAFDAPGNHPFRESSYQQAPTTNGHPGMHYQSHQSPYASNIGRDQQQQQLLPRAAPPPNAFEDFLENYVQARPNEYPARDQEELLQYARGAWDDPAKVEYRRVYEERYGRRFQEYMDSVNELEERERYERERERERGYEQRGRAGRYEEREVERELPPPPPPPPAAGAGALGGFTSINA